SLFVLPVDRSVRPCRTGRGGDGKERMSLHFHFIVVTNNPLVRERFEGQVPLDYQPRTFAGILEYVRDQIHKGHRLLSHPLSGSVKPGETPYKSIMISAEQGAPDTDSVILIEDCIQHAKKFRDR